MLVQIIEAMSVRRGELMEMVPCQGGKQRLTFLVPSRGMLGFKPIFVNITRGEGLMYEAFKGPLGNIRKGAIVCNAEGEVTRYALFELAPRGTFFVQPGEAVYGGMIVGEHSRDDEMECNITRAKALSNVRMAHAEKKVTLPPPRLLTLEDCIGYVAGDELIEVTPDAVRLRKQELDPVKRIAAARAAAKQRRE
ncbi:Tr-type G domain-containing protein, partial [Haematococcus lacustris]